MLRMLLPLIAVCRIARALSDDMIERAFAPIPACRIGWSASREKDGVLFVNDSKATNPTAAAPALAAFPQDPLDPRRAGQDRHVSTNARRTSTMSRKAYTIGEAGPMFARLLARAWRAVEECETLENAVNRAAADSQAGDTVLLSPASASFDQFRDFEARGDRFRELVEGL